MKKILVAGALALVSMATTAQAAPTPTVTFTANGTTVAAGTTIIQGFDLPAGTSIGTNAFVFSDSAAFQSVRPTGASGNFAAVLGNGAYTFVSPVATAMISFVVGSLDTYNSLTLNFADNSTVVLNDGQINNNNAVKEGVVTFNVTSGPLLSGLTFTTSGNSFEFDSIAAAVPEPAAWGMMILGFGLVGGVLRRRSSVNATVKFA